MTVRKVCQSFFNNALSPFHQYRKNALIAATAALINGASLTLSSIGRYMPGRSQVKNKIKRADRLLGNQSLSAIYRTFFPALSPCLPAICRCALLPLTGVVIRSKSGIFFAPACSVTGVLFLY